MSWLENAEWILQYVFSIMSSYQYRIKLKRFEVKGLIVTDICDVMSSACSSCSRSSSSSQSGSFYSSSMLQ
jgi:hypothetical protein